MQVSGIFEEVLCDAVGNPTYLRTTGQTQLAYKGREILGHGIDYHCSGFGSPIGHLKNFSRCLSLYTIDELKAHNIVIGNLTRLQYLSGVTVEGVLDGIHRQEQRNLILSFSNCTVTDLGGRVLFDPTWGPYDLAVGSAVTSVYGGVADREKLQLYKPTSGTQTLQIEQDEQLMSAYRQTALRNGEGHTDNPPETYTPLLAALDAFPNEWLLRVEMLEVADEELVARLGNELVAIGQRDEKLLALIQMALESL